jgi:hypothetical protein
VPATAHAPVPQAPVAPGTGDGGMAGGARGGAGLLLGALLMAVLGLLIVAARRRHSAW